jgi:hypothetical protein
MGSPLGQREAGGGRRKSQAAKVSYTAPAPPRRAMARKSLRRVIAIAALLSGIRSQ